jgi:multidrug efflux pump subunit AcrA (membrane-fusion protein)
MSKLTTSGIYETARTPARDAALSGTRSAEMESLEASSSCDDVPVPTSAPQVVLQRDAVEEAERQAKAAKAAAREARRSRVMDEMMLEAMRKRFEQRQQQNLRMHRAYTAS